MSSLSINPVGNRGYRVLLSLFAALGLALAQDQAPGPPPPDAQQQNSPNTGGWRRADEPAPNQAPSPNAGYPAPNYSQYPNQPAGRPPAGPSYEQPNYPPVPAQLTIKAGTFITVRVDQALSSDRNQAGDAFAATLVKPVVVDGVVVAQPGQTVGGRVVEAKKAGRVEGTSRLAVQLTDLTLVDGQQMPIHSQFVNRRGPTSEGRDAAAIAGTTGLGAAVGAAADWGRGAAIGAGAGAVVGIVGVLLTRGQPTIIYPESVLTFKTENPVTISTAHAPQAFHYIEPGEYDRPYYAQAPPARPAPAPYYYGGYPYYGYPYYGYPYYWGPGLAFYWGPGRYWGRGYYWGGGFGYRRFHR